MLEAACRWDLVHRGAAITRRGCSCAGGHPCAGGIWLGGGGEDGGDGGRVCTQSACARLLMRSTNKKEQARMLFADSHLQVFVRILVFGFPGSPCSLFSESIAKGYSAGFT